MEVLPLAFIPVPDVHKIFFNFPSTEFQKQQLNFWLQSKAVLKMALVSICMCISTFLFPTQTVFTDTFNLAEWKENIWV